MSVTTLLYSIITFQSFINDTQRHGKTLYDDYIEHKPGALQALRQYLEATTLPMKASSASNQSPTSSQAASIYTQNPIPTSARISTSSNAADQSANRPNNVQIASAQQDIEMGDPSTRRTLLLLCCIERRGRPVRLHQELVTHITDDRELFSTLRRIYYNHRGKIETLWSLRTLHSIHFMKVCLELPLSIQYLPKFSIY